MSNETRLMSGSLRIAQLDGAFSGADNTAAIYHKNDDGKLYWQMGSNEAKKFISAEDVSGSIAGETTRAMAAEAAIQADVSQNESDADAAIATEAASRSAADSSLVVALAAVQADVDANETASDDAEASLAARLGAEETARASAITTEAASRSTADSSIIVVMGAADSTLQGNIDALSSSVDADRFDLRGNNTAEGNTIFNGSIDADGGIAATTMVVEDLTEGCIVLAGTGGELEDSTRLTFDGSHLRLNSSLGGISLTGSLEMNGDIVLEEEHSVKAGSFVTYSDATLKTNIANMDGALEKVMSMRGVTYEMKHTAGSAEVGFLAQEMAQTVPEVVYGNGDGNLGIDYAKLTSVLVEAIKSQQEQIEELRATLLNK